MATGDAITPDGLRKLKAELAELEGPARRTIAARILAARELGDLKENADYHIAKDDQALLETRIARLRDRLRSAVVVETDDASTTFAFGRTARVRDEQTGELRTWTIVGPTEADRTQGRLSAESPIARALVDKPAGETIPVQTPGGIRRYTIEELV